MNLARIAKENSFDSYDEQMFNASLNSQAKFMRPKFL